MLYDQWPRHLAGIPGSGSGRPVDARPLSNSDGSSGDDTNSTQNKGRDVHKPRRKSFKISNDNNEKPAKEHEINNIKATQKNLEKDISELKGMFQQFTIQWFNAQPNNGNGSSTTNFLT